jgi:hypothetical protein
MPNRLPQLALLALTSGALWAQISPPAPLERPPMRDGRSLADRLAEARQRRDHIRALETTAQRALEYSKVYLDRAGNALRSDQPFVCDRLLGAAEALVRIAQLRDRLHEPDSAQDRGRPHGPEGDWQPPPAGALDWVYFRVQQADFFYDQSHDTEAKAFPKWAKDFYQLAVRALDRGDSVASEANARCAEEVVRALESLAQAAAPIPPPPGGPNQRRSPPRSMPDGQPEPAPKPESATTPSACSHTRTEETLG